MEDVVAVNRQRKEYSVDKQHSSDDEVWDQDYPPLELVNFRDQMNGGHTSMNDENVVDQFKEVTTHDMNTGRDSSLPSRRLSAHFSNNQF